MGSRVGRAPLYRLALTAILTVLMVAMTIAPDSRADGGGDPVPPNKDDSLPIAPPPSPDTTTVVVADQSSVMGVIDYFIIQALWMLI